MLSLTELGNRLREAREEKGWSLDDLQDRTKIQKRYLRGIEEGNYDVMPGHFYVRAFIKQYAETVDLNPEILFEEYKNDLPRMMNEELPDQLSRVKARKVSDRSSRIFDIIPKVLIAIFIIGALTLAWYFWSEKAVNQPNTPVEENNNTPIKMEERDSTSKDPKEDEVDEADSDQKEKSDKDEQDNDKKEKIESNEQALSVVEAAGRNSLYELKNTDKMVVKVVSTGESWIEIKNGKGYAFFAGMLTTKQTEGETVDLSNESEAVIVVGRASETEIYVNDEKLEFAVSPSEQVRQDIRIRFNRNNE